MEYYITYRNEGRPEKSPIMPDAEKNAQKNVELLKLQGATAVKNSFGKGVLAMPDNKPTIVTIYPEFDERAPVSIIYADRTPLDSPQCLKGIMGKDWMPNIQSQGFVKERWN